MRASSSLEAVNKRLRKPGEFGWQESQAMRMEFTRREEDSKETNSLAACGGVLKCVSLAHWTVCQAALHS